MCVAAIVVALALTGCNGVADDRYGGVPDEVELPPMMNEDGSFNDGPFVAWVEPGTTFAVVTYGSSSCPPTASAIQVTDAASVVVTFTPPRGSGPCTADLAPMTHEFAVPDGADERPLEVTVAWDGRGERASIVLD